MNLENKKNVVVIVPTYNESGSIKDLSLDILNVFKTNNLYDWNIKILVVDGNSSDNTSDLVKSLMDNYPDKIFLIQEKMRRGIGSAYIKGFDYAISTLKAHTVIEFDGDYQHPPAYIELLLKEIDLGYDYVLASRHIYNGGDVSDRSIFRKFLTGFGGYIARLILFFPSNNFLKVTDPTSGLKATRVNGYANKLDLNQDSLVSKHFGYKIQWLYEIISNGAKYKEIPLRFDNRKSGKSKFTKKVIFNIIKVCVIMRLRDRNTIRFMKYSVIGFCGYIVNALALSIFIHITNNEIFSWLFSVELAVVSNFTFDNIWTFRDRIIPHNVSWLIGLFKFNITSLGAIFIEGVFGPIIIYFVGPEYRQLILVFLILFLVVPYNWFIYNKFIWKK